MKLVRRRAHKRNLEYAVGVWNSEGFPTYLEGYPALVIEMCDPTALKPIEPIFGTKVGLVKRKAPQCDPKVFGTIHKSRIRVKGSGALRVMREFEETGLLSKESKLKWQKVLKICRKRKFGASAGI